MQRDVPPFADHPAIVWIARNIEQRARLQFDDPTVIHCCDRCAFQNEADVLHSASGHTEGRAHMFGPLPSRFVRRSADRQATNPDDPRILQFGIKYAF